MNKKQLIVAWVRGIMKWIAIPIITGLAVALLWHWFNVIKAHKINLYLPYAYEYKYLGATHNDPKRKVLKKLPIEIKLDKNNRGTLRLGIFNANIKTLKKVSFHILFLQDIKVINYSEKWTCWEPNEKYFTSVQNINNGIVASLDPLELEFEEPKTYKIFYTITGEDIKYIQRSFFVKAIK